MACRSWRSRFSVFHNAGYTLCVHEALKQSFRQEQAELQKGLELHIFEVLAPFDPSRPQGAARGHGWTSSEQRAGCGGTSGQFIEARVGHTEHRATLTLSQVASSLRDVLRQLDCIVMFQAKFSLFSGVRQIRRRNLRKRGLIEERRRGAEGRKN